MPTEHVGAVATNLAPAVATIVTVVAATKMILTPKVSVLTVFAALVVAVQTLVATAVFSPLECWVHEFSVFVAAAAMIVSTIDQQYGAG